MAKKDHSKGAGPKVQVEGFVRERVRKPRPRPRRKNAKPNMRLKMVVLERVEPKGKPAPTMSDIPIPKGG